MFFSFFNGWLRSPGGSEPNRPIFTKFQDWYTGVRARLSHWAFLIFQGTLPWQPIKVEKSAFFPDQSTLSRCHSKLIAISQFRFQKVQYNEFLYIAYNFGGIQSRNLRVYAVNNSTFYGDTAKIGISHKISQNILYLSWPTLQFW